MASMSFAGVSAIGEVSTPQPASATTAVTYSGYHLLVVNGYSSLVKDIPNGEFRESRRFKVGGYRWTLRCYPNGKEPDQDGDGYISFYLVLDQGNVFVPVMVQYQFSFVDQVLQIQNYYSPLLDGANETLTFCSRSPYTFSSPCLMMRREIFEKLENLENDSFTIMCDIVITKDLDINETGGTVPVSNMLPPPPDIRQDLRDLLQSGAGADVTFQVGDGTFKAHRCVLAARSAVFIHVRDMEEQVFKLLLDFIYSDSVPDVNIPEEEEMTWQQLLEEEEIMWQQLLEAADRYDLRRLKLMCEQELCAWINSSTVATILALAEQHHCRGLKEACLDFLNSPANLQQVMALDGLEPLVSSCPSVLKDLIGKLASLKTNTGNTGATALQPVKDLIDVPESDLHLHFSSLLQSEERTDVTFQVGGETFRAHRCVLAARSPVFRAELFGPMKEDTASNVTRIDDMEARVFKLLLTFIYSDSVPEANKEEKQEDDAMWMWQQLLVAADKYGVQGLKLMCETKLGRYINTNTVATILSVAEHHHCQRLKEECLDFLDCPAHLKQGRRWFGPSEKHLPICPLRSH